MFFLYLACVLNVPVYWLNFNATMFITMLWGSPLRAHSRERLSKSSFWSRGLAVPGPSCGIQPSDGAVLPGFKPCAWACRQVRSFWPYASRTIRGPRGLVTYHCDPLGISGGWITSLIRYNKTEYVVRIWNSVRITECSSSIAFNISGLYTLYKRACRSWNDSGD